MPTLPQTIALRGEGGVTFHLADIVLSPAPSLPKLPTFTFIEQTTRLGGHNGLFHQCALPPTTSKLVVVSDKYQWISSGMLVKLPHSAVTSSHINIHIAKSFIVGCNDYLYIRYYHFGSYLYFSASVNMAVGFLTHSFVCTCANMASSDISLPANLPS